MAELKPNTSAGAIRPRSYFWRRVALTAPWAGLAAIVLGAVLGQPVFAQSGVEPIGVPQETYLDAAEISGTIVAGLQFSGAPAARSPALTVLIPADWEGHVMCVRLASADGRYVALRSYAITESWRGGLVPVPYETAYISQLQAYEPTDMAVRVVRGSCEAPERLLAIAGWNIEHRTEPDGAFLLINSFRADETYLIDRASGEDFDCVPLQGEARTSFDTICPLPLAVLAGEGASSFEINRIRRGGFDPAELITIQKAPY
jgi:hypothetical protein